MIHFFRIEIDIYIKLQAQISKKINFNLKITFIK
jgi:hypothetical protein